MSNPIGAPGDGLSRRDFVKATGTAGIAAAAGCANAPQAADSGQQKQATVQAEQDTQRTTSPPEIVDVDEQGNQVTLKTVHARHDVHPLDNIKRLILLGLLRLL